MYYESDTYKTQMNIILRLERELKESRKACESLERELQVTHRARKAWKDAFYTLKHIVEHRDRERDTANKLRHDAFFCRNI